jgi:hypothetical protein
MKKHELLPVLDQLEKRLLQMQGLSNLILLAADNECHGDNELNGCFSLISDLIAEVLSNQNLISKSVNQLLIVSCAVNGTQGQ